MNKKQSGQALLEFALILPVLFLLIVNVVNFGALFYAAISVTHGARSAAQYAVTGPAYVGYGSAQGLQSIATATDITNLLTTCQDKDAGSQQGDLCSLPNRASIQVSVCTNNDGSGSPVVQTPPGATGCAIPPDPAGGVLTDPEPKTSVLAAVTVSYRYCPLIPFFEFPSLGVRATLPACSSDGSGGGVPLRRVAVMRMIQ